MSKKIIIYAVIACILVLASYFIFSKNQTLKPKVQEVQVNTLDEINNCQNKYFEIIKRNNALFSIKSDENTKKDLKELKELFDVVKSKVNPDCKFLNEYITIKTKFAHNAGNTMLEMSAFQAQKYQAFDKLLNDIYNELKLKLTEQDFEKLKASQTQWLKEAESYNEIFEKQNLGSIAALIKLDYEINIKAFRALLLMLYF